MASTIAEIKANPLVQALAEGVKDATASAATKSTNDLSVSAVAGASKDLDNAVAVAVQNSPELKFMTNEEPWYQKRSRWSAIISGVAVVAAPLVAKFGLNLDPQTQEFIVTACTTVGGLVAGWFAYRAGTATKPLGS